MCVQCVQKLDIDMNFLRSKSSLSINLHTPTILKEYTPNLLEQSSGNQEHHMYSVHVQCTLYGNSINLLANYYGVNYD